MTLYGEYDWRPLSAIEPAVSSWIPPLTVPHTPPTQRQASGRRPLPSFKARMPATTACSLDENSQAAMAYPPCHYAVLAVPLLSHVGSLGGCKRRYAPRIHK